MKKTLFFSKNIERVEVSLRAESQDFVGFNVTESLEISDMLVG